MSLLCEIAVPKVLAFLLCWSGWTVVFQDIYTRGVFFLLLPIGCADTERVLRGIASRHRMHVSV